MQQQIEISLPETFTKESVKTLHQAIKALENKRTIVEKNIDNQILMLLEKLDIKSQFQYVLDFENRKLSVLKTNNPILNSAIGNLIWVVVLQMAAEYLCEQ